MSWSFMPRGGGWLGGAIVGLFVRTTALLGIFAATPAIAQPVIVPPPVRQVVDAYGVNLATGRPVVRSEGISLGAGEGGLSFAVNFVEGGSSHNHMAWVSEDGGGAVVFVNGASRRFTKSGSAYISDQGAGETLVESSTDYTYVTSKGVVFSFSKVLLSNGETYYGEADALVSAVSYPSGVKWSYAYEQAQRSRPHFITYHIRLLSVESSLGYQLRLKYKSNNVGSDEDDWYRFHEVKIYNLKNKYCDRLSTSCSAPDDGILKFDYDENGVYGYIEEYDIRITNSSGGSTLYNKHPTSGRILDVLYPIPPSGSARPRKIFTYGFGANSGRVVSVQFANHPVGIFNPAYYVRNYSWTTNSGKLIATITDDLGRNQTTEADPTLGVLFKVTDALSNVTEYSYDSGGRLTDVERPEGDKTQVAYDARGNVSQVNTIAKPGSGLADIVLSATYPSSCSNQITCNLPLTTTDANGRVTEFDYDVTHGGVTEVREPADEDGVRPTTRFAYAQNYPRYMRSNSSVGNADAQVYVLTNTSKCRTGSAPACVGTAEEQVSEFTYTAGADATNLQVLEATVRAGSGTPTATVKFAYNTAGRISAIDGPQPSTADTTYQLYDTLGRVVAVVSPDPDGSGSLPRPVQTFTYATSGHLTETATGYTYSPWYGVTPPIVQMTREVLEYDMYGRLKALSTKAPGNTASASMVSYDYDNAGRLTCEIVRLSPPNSASGLPGTACTAMSAGVYGPDRISAYTYDTLDRVTEVRAAVGTPLEQVSLKQAYNSNGTTSWVEDSNGNRTAYEYDGFDRAAKAIFPSPTTPGTANAADYEAYTYDAAGNPLTRRTRAGETFSFAYDDRDRLLVKTVPERVGLASTHTRDVYYGYDLFGDLLFARFDSVSGEGVSAEYDALGRPTSIVTDIDGASRELSATFDIVGNVTSLTYPDSHTFTYQYDAFGRLTTLVDGSTPLAQFGYGSRGGVSSITRSAGGAPRSYFGYDALARPTQLGIDNAGSNGVEWLMGYSPAAQAVRVDRDNDAYAWDGHVNVDRNYTTNGLNQYSAVGSTTFTYDANGNLTSDGSAAFTYDPENRLVASTGGNGANLRYDPLGRLYEVIDTTTSDTTRFVYDGDALVAEYDGSGTLLRRHVHGVSPGDDPLITYEGATVGSANLRHLYADRLGSIVLMTDHDGVAPSINSYDEYGIPSSSNEGRFQYTGQVWLPELGMYYYKARMYSPTLGRFMQTDPIGYSDGMNWYAYTRNDPVNGVDPSGLAVVADGGHTMYLTGQMVCEVGQDPASGLCGDFWPGFVAPYVNIRYELENPVGFADVGGFGGGGAPVSGAAPPSPDIFVTALKAKAKTTAKSTTRGRVSGYRPQKEDGLLDKLKDLVCALPTLGIGGGADVYAGLGGSVGGSYNFDLANGRFGGSAYVGVGVGLGANVGVQGTGAPSGGGTVSANVGVSGGFAAPVAPGLNVGASGTYNVIGTDPGFSGGALGRAGTPSVYGNLQANGGFMTPSLYDLGC